MESTSTEPNKATASPQSSQRKVSSVLRQTTPSGPMKVGRQRRRQQRPVFASCQVCGAAKPKNHSPRCRSCARMKPENVGRQMYAECSACGKPRSKPSYAPLCIPCRGKAIRRQYEDLRIEDFNGQKLDGRTYAFFWDDDRKRTVYRYRWLWEQVYGPIPDGHVIHHQNGDPADDRMENLELKTVERHSGDHFKGPQNPRWIGGTPTRKCETCGKEFNQYDRRHGEKRRYCSADCRTAGSVKPEKHEPIICATCGKTFIPTYGCKTLPKYCSRKCFSESRPNQLRSWTCENCGETFQARLDHGREPRFCSRSCLAIAGSVTVQCDWCGKTIKRPKSMVKPRNFCSRTCLAKARQKTKTLCCASCGKTFNRAIWKIEPSKSGKYFCSGQCYHQDRRSTI